MKHISRYEVQGSGYKGYRILITHKQNPIRKYFSDKKYGGKKKAYEETKKYLDKIIKKYNLLAMRRNIIWKGWSKYAFVFD